MPKVKGGESGLMEYVTTQIESQLDWDLISWVRRCVFFLLSTIIQQNKASFNCERCHEG